MNKVLGIIILVVVVIFFAKGCGDSNKKRELQNQITVQNQENAAEQEEIKRLKQQLEEANKELIELELQLEQEIKAEDYNYLNVKFAPDGNYYKEAYDVVTFYSDPYCTKKIYDVRFMSPEIDSARAENGLNIYCLRLDNGEICYCTESPYLITEGKYNERKAEE